VIEMTNSYNTLLLTNGDDRLARFRVEADQERLAAQFRPARRPGLLARLTARTARPATATVSGPCVPVRP
jgi:hypothetical protein